jgi:hypothetical protein
MQNFADCANSPEWKCITQQLTKYNTIFTKKNNLPQIDKLWVVRRKNFEMLGREKKSLGIAVLSN